MDLKTIWKKYIPSYEIRNELSFQPLLNWWEKRSKESSGLYNIQLKKLLQESKGHPLLLQDKIELEDILNDPEALSFVVHSISPVSLDPSKQLFMMSLPFSMDIIHASTGFEKHFLCDNAFSNSSIGDKMKAMYFTKTFMAYKLIFKKFYDLDIDVKGSLVYEVLDTKKIKKYFFSEINTDFVDVFSEMELPDKAIILKSFSLKKGPGKIELENWKKILPIDRFIFRGFCFINLRDITPTESIYELNNALLHDNDFSSPGFLENVEDCVKSLLNCNQIKIGVAAFQKFDNKYLISDRRIANSFLIKHLCKKDCHESYGNVVEFLSTVKSPIFLNDFTPCDQAPASYQHIREIGIEEIILVPLQYGENLVGVLEICAQEKGILNNLMLKKLKPINQPLAIALQKNMKQFEFKVQQIIRNNYTAIQPSIEWKFNEVAVNKVLDQENGLTTDLQPVVFEQVYPLYAAVDIRDSSSTRLESIQKDLRQQLNMALDIIHSALKLTALPVLEKMAFKIQEMLDDIQLILVSDDESKINNFINQDLDPLFHHLREVQPSLKIDIDEYFSHLDPELGVHYDNRKAYEESLEMINIAISRQIDQAQVEAQKMFPHYFEKYKTDGVDYNIYIGQSLVNNRVFDPIYLKNLKLWQLSTLCESAFVSQSIQETLPIQLETTQLLLVHSNPLSISFRMDERKFDVEGAYNIRYEILKKRIDKALIKNTKERLTQPGTISIIYSQAKEAEEYQDYIGYLQLKGLLGTEVEQFDLEDLQGVNGLKALRVKVGKPQAIPFPPTEHIKTESQK
ncbi:hypothetical protein QWY93_05965 [Echinicola jeungdonensis]|uniref:GAF domain-containing protein n=1 Tax=Echinicola jeungdonensis TaxID=709343 RepID=A0ABV5J4R1_9BACT|nr:hypothetical protein [Echinicola jeungdonensis]MDN3668868.1 hypothetical protein [Echinicola jeungdonensis]